MREDPIVEEVHQIRQELLAEFGGDVDALVDEMNRRLLSGEYGDFKIITRAPRSARATGRGNAESCQGESKANVNGNSVSDRATP